MDPSLKPAHVGGHTPFAARSRVSAGGNKNRPRVCVAATPNGNSRNPNPTQPINTQQAFQSGSAIGTSSGVFNPNMGMFGQLGPTP